MKDKDMGYTGPEYNGTGYPIKDFGYDGKKAIGIHL
jgi:hypothetical protein